MSITQKQSQIDQEKARLSALDQERTETQDRLQTLQSELNDLKIGTLCPQTILQSGAALFQTQINKMKLQEFLTQYPVIRLDLVYAATGQYCLQVAFDGTQDFEPQLRQVQDFIPYLTIQPEIFNLPLQIAGLHIKVKEVTLGEDGLYEIVKPTFTNEIWFTRTQGGIFSILKKFQSWNDVLNHVYSNHPYYI
jgi:hypothetical protein